MGGRTVVVEGRLVGSGRPARIEARSGRIASIEPGRVMDLWLAPGFIDIQVNGYKGFDVNSQEPSAAEVVGLVEALWSEGVTTVCPTVVTAGQEEMCQRLAALPAAARANPLIAHCIPLAHVEGPSLSPEDGPRGAHEREHIRPPSQLEYGQWQKAAGGLVGILTLAPEQPGAEEYIKARSAEGLVVAIGHTAASPAQLRGAVGAGARLSAHLGNGCHEMLPRLENHLWLQLAEDRLWASFIFDGHHLPPAVMKVMLRAKGPDRSVLVSDAVALAGSPPGTYRSSVGGMVQLSADGRLGLAGTGQLAGATKSIAAGIANAVAHAGANLAAAVRMASANPARLLGLAGAEGRGLLQVGAAADICVFHLDEELQELKIQTTVARGDPVYRRPG